MQRIPVQRIRDSNYWKPSLDKGYNKTSNSWFDIKVKKLEDNERFKSTINTKFLRCEKIILNPNQTQRNILKTWLEIYRQVYNLTVYYFKKHEIVSAYDARKTIRKKIVKNPYLNALITQSKIPLHTVNNAIFDVTKAYKTGFANLKAKRIKFFRLRYKKFSNNTQILVLEPQVFNSLGTGLKNKNLRNLNPSIPIHTECEVRLSYNSKTKKFTLFVPGYYTIDTNKFRYEKCALDPGIRTFQTVYSPGGVCYQINNGSNKIKKYQDKIEKVKLLKDKKWYYKFTSRLYLRVQNCIADLHWKTANFLCKRFDNIMIGKLSTIDIVKKENYVLNPRTKRLCYALSHYLFRERLKSKCEEYNVQYQEVNESYTSKTCGGCGELKDDLGAAKIFNCAKLPCSYKMNRDIHGARNILIKHTSE